MANVLRAAYHTVPFSEPEGHTTWAVREEINGPNLYYRRQLVSFHPTKREAEAACAAFGALTTETAQQSTPRTVPGEAAEASDG